MLIYFETSFPVKVYQQLDTIDCGPTCLRMIAKHYGRSYTLQDLRRRTFLNKEGASLLGISEAAESIGFRSIGVKLDFEKLQDEVILPCIVHWNQNHFVVVYKIKKNKVWIADPAGHKKVLDKEEFLNSWLSDNINESPQGVVLILEPTPEFYKKGEEQGEFKRDSLIYLFSYFRQYKKFVFQLFLGLLVGSLIQLIFPFLTQSIVDVGINTRDVNFIYLILFGQLLLVMGRTTVDFIRQWILLHLSTRVNISILSDFLIKLMQLPLSFFDSKMIGDLLQRLNDHSRIQQFLSTYSLNVLFSFFNLIVFGIVLFIYHSNIFLVFFGGSIFYFIYVILFLKKRKIIDHKRFEQQSANQSSVIQLITGMQEIKLNGAEKLKRWEWERIQAKIFNVNIESTKLQQYQQSGSLLINELKNIIITFMAAIAVINGEMTFGMMLAVQYIIGQLNAPINEGIKFISQWQDAKISLERIGEIHHLENEEEDEVNYENFPKSKSISLRNLTFSYGESASVKALNNVSISIPEKKITAIVGSSGSGKTTLLKLLLKMYNPSEGSLLIGDTNFRDLSAKQWRKECGVVMQDGKIFSDTIGNNIALGAETPDSKRLLASSSAANIHEFIDELPLRYNTKIGNDGIGLSQGQKQRILIARAIHKDPKFLFFDEATSALDANNEKVIMDNLYQFFEGRTVVVIAHRLSTVKNADQIIVIEKGEVIEKGTHNELVKNRGNYFNLIKNQLELGE